MGSAVQQRPHEVLDACHREMLLHLGELSALASRLGESGLDATARATAGQIEAFFSATARDHHALEERSVFPPLLAQGKPEVVAAVRTLQQDHGWIEENWIELSPQLAAIADGQTGFDPDEFAHAVEVFVELCQRHIALEESLIYPQSRELWARGRGA